MVPHIAEVRLFSWDAASRMWYASMYREELLFNVVGYLRGERVQLACVIQKPKHVNVVCQTVTNFCVPIPV